MPSKNIVSIGMHPRQKIHREDETGWRLNALHKNNAVQQMIMRIYLRQLSGIHNKQMGMEHNIRD